MQYTIVIVDSSDVPGPASRTVFFNALKSFLEHPHGFVWHSTLFLIDFNGFQRISIVSITNLLMSFDFKIPVRFLFLYHLNGCVYHSESYMFNTLNSFLKHPTCHIMWAFCNAIHIAQGLERSGGGQVFGGHVHRLDHGCGVCGFSEVSHLMQHVVFIFS